MQKTNFREQFINVADACALAQSIVDTIHELVIVLDLLVKKSQSGSAPSVFSEITDDDIDNLFND